MSGEHEEMAPSRKPKPEHIFHYALEGNRLLCQTALQDLTADELQDIEYACDLLKILMQNLFFRFPEI